MPKQYVLGLLIFFFVAASAFVIWFSMAETSKTQEIRGQAYGNSGGGSTGGGSTGGSSRSTCTENNVNVQFRIWTGQDTPWLKGDEIKLKVGDYVDVNCFAKNGTALLQNPFMSLHINNSQREIDIRTMFLGGPSAEIRKFQVYEAGVYAFFCKNENNTCSDVDRFTVEATPHTSPFCKRTGCSNQLCVGLGANTDKPTTCDFKPEYACYQVAECEPQPNDLCGFTPSTTLKACLAKTDTPRIPSVSPSPSPSSTPTTRNYALTDLNKDGKTDIQDYVVFFGAYKQNSGL